MTINRMIQMFRLAQMQNLIYINRRLLMFQFIYKFSPQQQGIDWISLGAMIVALVAALTAWYTSHTNNKLSQASIILHLYELEMKNRDYFLDSEKQLKEILNWIKNDDHFEFYNFYEELSKEKYKELRIILNFYEYLGSIVKLHQISFKQVFSIMYFPEELSKDVKILHEIVKKKKRDFLENYDYLYTKYERARKKIN